MLLFVVESEPVTPPPWNNVVETYPDYKE